MNFRKILLKTTEKWPAKIISVAAALVISVFYRLNTIDSRILTIPLNIETSGDFIHIGSVTNSVRVVLRGDTNDISTVTEDDILAYIDLSKLTKTGTHRVPIQIRKTGSALSIEPLEISVSPVDISITLEEKVSRFIHVYPVFSGTVAAGFEITNHSITPESVSAEGPKSVLDNLKEFTTEPIDLDGRNFDFSALVKIKNDNPDITIYGNKMVEYNSTIRRIERTRIAPYIFILPDEDDTAEEEEES